jgi:hypothetical protein
MMMICGRYMIETTRDRQHVLDDLARRLAGSHQSNGATLEP